MSSIVVLSCAMLCFTLIYGLVTRLRWRKMENMIVLSMGIVSSGPTPRTVTPTAAVQALVLRLAFAHHETREHAWP